MTPRFRILCLLVLMATPGTAAISTTGGAFFAQFVDGAGWKSKIILQNQSNRDVPFRLEFRDPAGARLDVTLLPGTSRFSVYEGTLKGLATVFLETPGTAATLSSGSARLSSPSCPTTDAGAVCNPGIALVSGTLIFQQKLPGRPAFEASVPLDQTGSSLAIPIDNSPGYTTAFALLNPSAAQVRVRLDVLDESGLQLASTTLTLGGRERGAWILRDLFPQMAGRRGTLRVVTLNTPVVGIGLLFGDDGPFSTLLMVDSFVG